MKRLTDNGRRHLVDNAPSQPHSHPGNPLEPLHRYLWTMKHGGAGAPAAAAVQTVGCQLSHTAL